MTSGGVTSWYTAFRVREKESVVPVCVFADTLIEDEDLYRFLCESTASLAGVPLSSSLRDLLRIIPDVRKSLTRRLFLKRLSRQAQEEIPNLVWLMDGRNPWEVFRDVRFVGNSRTAPCSHKLKQDVCRKYVESQYLSEDVILYVGIHYSESERFHGKGGTGGIKDRWMPYRTLSPLCDPPYFSTAEVHDELRKQGLTLPRLYDMGFSHNNCGGFCVKGGHSSFRRLLEVFPDRYKYHEGREEREIKFLGKDVSILRSRKGGKVTPLPLRRLRLSEESGEVCEAEVSGEGGCGCFFDEIG
jgi:hypothetical protein